MRNRTAFWFLVFGSAILSVARPVGAANPLPQVVLEEGVPVLQLPERLAEFIQAKFPDLRVVGKEDMTGGWATFRGKREVPHGSWGAFNGDGLTDVALILLGKGYWRLLAFQQLKDGSYAALKLEEFPGPDDLEYTQIHPAQDYYLATLKAGELIRLAGKPLQETGPKHDAITFFMVKDASSAILYEWTAATDAENADFRRNRFYLISSL